MRRTRSRHVGRSVLIGVTTPNRNGLVMSSPRVPGAFSAPAHFYYERRRRDPTPRQDYFPGRFSNCAAQRTKRHQDPALLRDDRAISLLSCQADGRGGLARIGGAAPALLPGKRAAGRRAAGQVGGAAPLRRPRLVRGQGSL